jgi:hypothetical protein
MQNIILGTGSVGVIEGIQNIPSTTPTIDIVKITIQIIVGVATLWKMFKKPKEVKRVEGSYINQTT